MTLGAAWRVRLTESAQADLDAIGLWTTEHFGVAQAARYSERLVKTIGGLAEPFLRRGRSVAGLPASHRAIVAGSHRIVFVLTTPRTVLILRILHAAMDPARHLDAPDPGA